MVREYLKRYKVTLETIGPVFIGSGEQINKSSWILDRKNGIAYIIDEVKLFTYLKGEKLLSSFEDYMINDKRPQRDLNKWVNDYGISKEDIKKVTKYTINCDDIAEVNTVKNIKTFIKDAYGKPYIPGSSLKGALRNVILSKLIDNGKPDVYRNVLEKARENNVKNPKTYMQKEANNLENQFLHTRALARTKPKDAVNDIMSGIRISDSKPLKLSDLTLCEKIDAALDGSANSPSIFRECIRPHVKIEFSLTVDTTIFSYGISFIEDAISEFLENYNKEFLSKFKKETYHDNIIYLGGGAGFHTKTVTSNLLAKEEKRVELTSNIIINTVNEKMKKKHDKDKDLGVSPHIVKITKVDGRYPQFGPCRIYFEKI